MAQKTKQIQKPNALNTAGVVITGLVFGANATADDANEWGRWNSNQGNPDSEFNQRQGPGGPDFNNGSSNSGGGDNNNPNDGKNNQSDPKIGSTFDNTTSGSGSSTAAVDKEWVIFGAYANGPAAQRYTVSGDLKFNENNGTAYGGSVELNLTDSDHSRNTQVTSDNVNVDLAGTQFRTFYGGTNIPTAPGADFDIVAPGGTELLNLQRRIRSTDPSPVGAGTECGSTCTTVAAYGSTSGSSGGSVLANLFFASPERAASTGNDARINFVAGEATSTAGMAALSGVTSATYVGSTEVYRDTVVMNVNFNASTFNGTVNDIIFRTDDLSINGTISGASFTSTSIQSGAFNANAGSTFNGSFVGPNAQGAVGRVDVDINIEGDLVNYNDVFAAGFRGGDRD